MGVSLHTRARSHEIGSASFFSSWFSTICVRLENGSWGARFPVIMKELYAGAVNADRVTFALRELENIRAEMAHLSAQEVVWDHEDRTKQPPWGNNISPTITSLATYFVTANGKDLFGVIREALEEAGTSRCTLIVR